jgi:hypothetical protein
LAVIACEHISEDIHDTFHLLDTVAADVHASVLHRQRDSLVRLLALGLSKFVLNFLDPRRAL